MRARKLIKAVQNINHIPDDIKCVTYGQAELYRSSSRKALQFYHPAYISKLWNLSWGMDASQLFFFSSSKWNNQRKF